MCFVRTAFPSSVAEPAVTDTTWPELLRQLVGGEDLEPAVAEWAMDQIMSGTATPAQIAAFVVALRAKGERPAEIAGLATSMLAHARRVTVDVPAVDVVGTGGDRAHTVNISTMAAMVTAAAGAPVVKHGNRAASSRCGAADLLEQLGIAIDLQPDAVAACVRELGIGFCFAPVFHPAFRHASGPRREIGIPTAFNFLGPLTNPAQPSAALVGCADRRMAPVMADVFAGRGASVLVVRGDDDLDEITTGDTTSVWRVRGGVVDELTFDPAEVGIARSAPGQLRGGEPQLNAEVAARLFSGETGPVRDAVLLNAAAALAVYRGLGDDLVADIAAALGPVAEAIDSGAVIDLLARWAARSGELSAAAAS
jgi:anthranilate phosphoribosyltransferase